MEIKHIIMPYLGTPKDEDLLKTVCNLANSYKGKVTVVHVLEIPMNLPVDAEEVPGSIEANEMLDKAEEIGSAAGAKVETELLQARDAGHAIVEEAISIGADLIIMEARQRQRLGMLTLGRTTDYVLKHAPMAVWISRYPALPAGE